MKAKSILLLMLLAGMTGCQKDNHGEPAVTPEAQEVFSFTGEWYCPSIEWLADMNLSYYSIGDIIGHQGHTSLYKTIRFIEGCDLASHWQGCFVWELKRGNTATSELQPPDTIYYSVDDNCTIITLYVQTQDHLYQVPMQVVSPAEMIIDGENYLRPADNTTPMVSLPNHNWHYDFSSNGFYYKGSYNRGQLDLTNPIYKTHDGKLWVSYDMFKCQVVRPYIDYNALAEQPHGLFDCAGSDVCYEEKNIDYHGVTQLAMVQTNGGQWCDTICEYAFAGCKELKEVVLGEQVIKPYAFYGCSLKGIFLWFVPQAVASTAFDDWQYEHTAVHVSKYHPELLQTVPWCRFRHAYADLEHQ